MVAALLVARLLGPGILALEEANAARVAAGLTAKELPEGFAEFPERMAEQSITLPVSSSAIRTIGYRPPDTIVVEFVRGGTYSYDGSFELFMAFAGASSKGEFFNSNFQVERSTGIPRTYTKKISEGFRVLRRTPGK